MKNLHKSAYLLIALIAAVLSSCGSSEKTTSTATRTADSVESERLIDSLKALAKADSATDKAKAPAIDTTPKIAFENYRAAATIINELVHTELYVSFDYAKQYLYGKATITLQPYFYSTDSLTLDAKGMDIHEVALMKGKNKIPLKYTYDSLQLHILLDKTYNRGEQYKVFIDYTSRPNQLKEQQQGSAAITSHKGLFFINPDGKDKTKPREIWTQGETEDNSCWFPTIDKPDQRMTEEIYMTVEKTEKTLSNGALVSSVENKDNTRTDHWVMKPGIPPYLVMMAVGPFSIIHDKWRKIPVDYYVDAKYAPYAKDIFGKTPQMIEFFSDILHFPYPWNKYDQVVVHDYVSGAMENTTATLHGSFLNKTRRELMDDPLNESEDIISHELFHHWFGDMVTCESWSNITLNESFADYGEFLWRQHAWGEDCAEQYMVQSVGEYLNSMAPQHDLVDFYYNNREDVFDEISYNKGGGILHMLRQVVGDSAFFDALHLYLEDNKFTAAEVPQLRLAFEKVTGRDLNWFFNEWYYNKGYPLLSINHTYDPASGKVTVTVRQMQDLTQNPVFEMPLQVDIYVNGKKESHPVIMNKTINTYVYSVASKPDLVLADGKHTMVVSVKNENMSLSEREYQYNHLSSYFDKHDALKDLSNHLDDAGARSTMMKALQDPYWALREFAIEKMGNDSSAEFKHNLINLVNDSSPIVRSSAITALSSNYKDESLMPIYKNAINDSSYGVESSALEAIASANKQEGMAYAKKLENSDEPDILISVAAIYTQYGNDSCNQFFVSMQNKVTETLPQVEYVALYAKFLQRCSDSSVSRGVPIIGKMLKNTDNKYISYYAKNGLNNLLSVYQAREQKLTGEVNDLKANNTGQNIKDLQRQLDSTKNIESLINSYLE